MNDKLRFDISPNDLTKQAQDMLGINAERADEIVTAAINYFADLTARHRAVIELEQGATAVEKILRDIRDTDRTTLTSGQSDRLRAIERRVSNDLRDMLRQIEAQGKE